MALDDFMGRPAGYAASLFEGNPRLQKEFRQSEREFDRSWLAQERARQLTLPQSVIGPPVGAGSQPGPGMFAQGPMVGPGAQPYAMGRAGVGNAVNPYVPGPSGGSLARQAAGQVIDTTGREIPQGALGAGAQPIQATYARNAAGAAGGMADDVALALGRGGPVSLEAATQGTQAAAQAVPVAMGATRNAGITALETEAAGGARGLLGKLAGQGMGLKWGIGAPLAGIAASTVSKKLWNDPNSSGDDILSGFLSGAGTGAGVGSFAGPWGALAGGVGGGLLGAWNGLQSSHNEGYAATTSEFQKQNAKLEAQFAELGVPESMRSDLRDQIMMTYTLTEPGKKGDVSAIFDQARSSIPSLIGQYRDEETAQARSAAIQSIIMPMLQQQQTGYIDESRKTAATQMAYANQLPPEIAAMQRLQAQQIVSDAYGYNQASLGVLGAAAGIEGLIPGAGSQVIQGGEQGAPQLDLTNLIASNRQV